MFKVGVNALTVDRSVRELRLWEREETLTLGQPVVLEFLLPAAPAR